MRKIEKPELISTIRDKKKVWLNIRESRLMYMFHRKLISIEEYEADVAQSLIRDLDAVIEKLNTSFQQELKQEIEAKSFFLE